MADDFEDTQTNFNRRFRKVYQEIDYLESKIYQTEGWIFKNHVYTKEELLNSPQHERIYSITEKIGDDAQNWHIRGKLSNIERAAYWEHRGRVDDRLLPFPVK